MSRPFSSITSRALAAATLSALLTAPAHAVLVNFTASGDSETIAMSNGLDATASLDFYSDSVDLTPGVPQTVLINGGSATLFQGAAASGSGTLGQTLSVQSGGSQSISQGVSILTSAPNPPFVPASADVSIFAGASVLFTLGGGAYELTVTPVGGSRIGQTSTSIPLFNNAEFLLTAVPEPAAGLVLVGAAAALLARRRLRV